MRETHSRGESERTATPEIEGGEQPSAEGTTTADRRSTLQAVGAGGLLPFLPLGKGEAAANESGPPATEWSALFDVNGGKDRFEALVEAPDGGFALVGATDPIGAAREDAWILKTDATGAEQWRQTLGDATDDRSFDDVVVVPSTGYAIGGNRSTSDDESGEALPSSGWFRRTDVSGTEQANKFYSAGNLFVSAESLVRESDGEFTLAGSLLDLLVGEGDSGWLQKMDADGTRLWERSYSGAGGGWDSYFSAHVQTSDCGYALAGETGNPAQGWLLKTDASGTEQWQQTYGAGTDYRTRSRTSPGRATAATCSRARRRRGTARATAGW